MANGTPALVRKRALGSFAPRSRVKPGDEVEVVVDTERMHFFDPRTSAAIRA
jgi:multiple sugar transport system ATP-binding protein